MSISETLTADVRARSIYLPACPLCSFVNIPDCPDVVRWPNYRKLVLPVNRLRDVPETIYKFESCCAEYRTDERFASMGDVAIWWRSARMQPLRDIATNNRRLNCLAKLLAKNLEPLDVYLRSESVLADGALTAAPANKNEGTQ